VKRIAAILATAALAAGCGGQSMDQWVKERLTPQSASDRIVRIENGQADQRREGLQKLAADPAARKTASVVKLFCLVAQTDEDPMVRSAAVRGLAEMEGDGVVAALTAVATRDKSPFVRADAAKSLGRHPGPETIAALAQVRTNDSNEDVRVAAAEALRQFKEKAAAEALVAALADSSLAVSLKAWESLRYMTGQDFARSPEPWDDFFAKIDDPFLLYGRPPALPKGRNQRPQFTKGPLDFINGLFAKDVREAELE